MFIGDSNQSHPEWLSRMLPLSYTRYTISRVTPLSQLIKSHDTVLLVRPGPPLSIRLLHTILAGGHFPPKINDDFCLAFYINPSSMLQNQPRTETMKSYESKSKFIQIYRKINLEKMNFSRCYSTLCYYVPVQQKNNILKTK